MLNSKHAMSSFIQYLKVEKNFSSNTVENYQRDLDDYLKYLNENKITDLEETNDDLISNFIATLYDKSLAISSISRKISCLKSFYKFLYVKGYLNENKASLISLPKKQKKIPQYLTTDEIIAFLATFNDETSLSTRNKIMAFTMYYTGTRVSELISLKMSQLYLNDKYLKIKGKGSKERIIPLNDDIAILLDSYIKTTRKEILNLCPSDYLFVNKKGNCITRQGFFKIVKQHCLLANITKNVSPHTIRHSFATSLLNNDVDLRTLQVLLGHSDISTTQIYTHINSDYIKKSYLKAHKSNKKL